MRKLYRFCIAALPLLCGLSSLGSADILPRAIVADFENVSRDRHTAIARTATDAVAVELSRRNVYEVVGRQELDRVARTRGIQPPYREQDLRVMARELDASLIVTGEVRHVDFRIKDDQKEIE